MDLDYYLKVGLTGALIGIVASTSSLLVHNSTNNCFPNDKKVQAGYIAPSRLEICLEDLDLNGEKETIVKVDKKPYLLKEADGRPQLLPYEIKVSTK